MGKRKPRLFGDENLFLKNFDLPPLSDWVERNRVLGPPAQERGPLRLARTPYFRDLLDMVTQDDVERVVICKSAQVAGTEFTLSVIGYYAHLEPCPIMFVLADEDTAVYINRERIHGMFKYSPTLREIFEEQSALARDVVLKNGATITVGWASSVARLASRPIRIVVLDEVDKPGYSLKTKEGDPISLAIQRTETFFGRKIIILSTPTTEDGNIWRELHACDVIYDWHVPCPKCGVLQPLVWSPEHTLSFSDGKYRSDDGTMKNLGRVVWEGGRDATQEQIDNAKYKCGSCGALWSTIEKNIAVQKGRLVPRTVPPARIQSIGFHINRLYSLLGNSGDIPKLVKEWILAIKSGHRKMQAFINNALGEPYRYTKSSRKTGVILRLKDDRPSGIVPSQGVIALTAGVDVQDNGFFYVIRAWGGGLTSWLVRHGFVDRWDALEAILFGSDYKDTDGNFYPVRLSLVDSGGHRTAEVYQFCRKWKNLAVPIKGRDELSRPFKPSRIDTFPNGKSIPGGLTLYHLDVSYFKDLLDMKLSISPGDIGAFYLNADADDEYARHMTSETRDENGKWVAARNIPNHYWDCEVYALAGAVILGIEFYQSQPNHTSPVNNDRNAHSSNSSKSIARRVVRSRWLYNT